MATQNITQRLLLIFHAIAGSGNRWRTLALFFFALNYKNLPFVWHLRFFNAALRHSVRPKPAPKYLSSTAYPLFLPVITSTRAPISECDYNIHKSNSTYFSDLDVSRTHLVSLLCSPGIPDYQRRRKSGEAEGRLLIGLGGVACCFINEIKPYEGYELWTRVLCWDRKWVYTVTHFVRKGVVKPDGYLMNAGFASWFGRKDSTNKTKQEKKRPAAEGDVNGAGKKDIFAFAISKYVFKYGRRTIPPEAVLERCGQLPPRPKSESTSPPESSTPDSATEESSITERSMDGFTNVTKEAEELAHESITPANFTEQGWTWEQVEEERKRGMEIAQHMLGLDGLKEEFTGDAKPALGVYRDLLWA